MFRVRSNRQQQTLAMPLALWVGMFALSLPASFSQADRPSNAVPPIDNLLKHLDADSYRARETAAQQLASHGEAALKPMALHSLTSTPESSWRIRTIIEQIGTAGSEETFCKSTGVLRLLYPLDDAKTRQRLETLKHQWKLARKNKAIKHLRSLGAIVSDPYGDQLSGTAAQRWQLANGARVVVNGRVLNQPQVSTASTRSTDQAKASSVQKRPSLTRRQLVQQIDELLRSDLATNRERIFGDDEAASKQAASQAPQRLRNPGLGDPFMGNALRVNQFRFGATAMIGKDFRGSAEDLKTLERIPNIALVHWKDRKLSADEMEAALSMSSIQRVQFENCTFPDDPLPESAWPRFATHFEFINQTIPVWVVERLQDSVVNSLKFSKCRASDVLHEQLRKMASLDQLALEETMVDEKWFETFASVRTLTRVELTLCKFKTEEYRALVSRRPKLAINFVPQGFLGIRSPDRPNVKMLRAAAVARQRAAIESGQKLDESELMLPPSNGCAILEVIPGSGAEAAGLLPGDVIEKVNGHSIVIFEDIRLIVAQHRAGDELKVQFSRNGKEESATIKLGKFPRTAIK